MHDCNGKPVAVGDDVILRGTVTEVHPEAETCNINVEMLHQPIAGRKETIITIAGCCEKDDATESVIGLGSQVTINGVSLTGQVISVDQNLHSVKRFCVRTFNGNKKPVEFWYYAQELTLRPADEAVTGEGTEENTG